MAFDPDALDRRDPRLIGALLPAFEAVAARYLRVRRDGLEHLSAAPAVLVGNHNGGIAGPDLVCTLATLWRAHGPAHPLYALAHDFAMRQLTLLGRVLQRIGAVRATPENAHRVLDGGGQVLVYPGGDLEAYRHSKARDRIVLGERTGFVRVARDAGVPIIPIVAHGAHRSAWIFSEGKGIARLLRLAHWGRLERFPLAIAAPWGLGVGPWTPYLPLPFPIRLRVLPPIAVGAEDDAAEVQADIQARMQATLDDLAAETRDGDPGEGARP